MQIKGLKKLEKFFAVDFDPICNNDILDDHKYLMEETWYKITPELTEKYVYWIMSWNSRPILSKKCVSLSNQKCMAQPILIII